MWNTWVLSAPHKFSELDKCVDDILGWFGSGIRTGRYFVHFQAAVLLHKAFNSCNDPRRYFSMGLSRSRKAGQRTDAPSMLSRQFISLLHKQTCIVILSFHAEIKFAIPKAHHRTLFFRGGGCRRNRHFYTTAEASCTVQASCWYLSSTARTASCNAANLQINLAVSSGCAHHDPLSPYLRGVLCRLSFWRKDWSNKIRRITVLPYGS